MCKHTIYIYDDWDKYEGFSSAGSTENSKAVSHKITDIIIKDYIKRHLFHDIERENQKTRVSKIEKKVLGGFDTDYSDSGDESNITYEGPRFKKGCALFDKHVLSQHRDMEEERTKYKTEDAVAMNSSASLILQHVICKGIDIIKHQGCSRFDLINEAFTSQVGEPPNSTMTTEAEKQTGTTTKPTSSKATSATS